MGDAIGSLHASARIAPTIGGVSNSGTDVTSTGYTPLLAVLGKGYNTFLSKGELRDLVSQYNSTVAGTLTPAGKAGLVPNQKYPTITLPTQFDLGDNFTSQDLRITKNFRLHEEVSLRLIGEVFNLFNASNLTGYNFNLASPASFGKPTPEKPVA